MHPISRWQGRLFGWVNGQRAFRIHLPTDEERVRLGGLGPILLTTNAAPAQLVLARYLDDPNRDTFVVDIFCNVGDSALFYLTAGFTSTNAVAITNVLRTLQRMAHRSIPAREMVAAALSYPSPAVRAAAVAHFTK